jgi:hypothetical protein
MLNNQIISGYQGWFGYPGDGASEDRWIQWFAANSSWGAMYEALKVDLYRTMD